MQSLNGSGEYFFLVGRGYVDDRTRAAVDRVAAKHGVTFVRVNLPGEGWRFWFSGPNRGAPFDRELAARVRADLDAAELFLPPGLG